MTTDMPADLTRVRDHSHDPVVVPHVDDLVGIAPDWTGDLSTDEFIAAQRTGWVPPPPEDSAFYTPLCAHRDEVAYEWDMDLVADLRRVADEIQAARHAAYPQLVTPLKKRRAPKKTAGKS